jgi:Domain of unknown function (DUF6916)
MPFNYMTSRRQFIFDCSAVMVAVGAAPLSAFSLPAISDQFQSLDQISYAILAGQVNTTFRICLSRQQVVKLKLLKAPVARQTFRIPGRRPPADAGNEKFSLIFSGPKDQPLEPAIYRFEQEHLGGFEMYIGQIGRSEGEHVRYEAVFNRPPPVRPLSAMSA